MHAWIEIRCMRRRGKILFSRDHGSLEGEPRSSLDEEEEDKLQRTHCNLPSHETCKKYNCLKHEAPLVI